MAGKEINGWLEEIGKNSAYRTVVRYYDQLGERIADIRYDQDRGILASQQEVLFLNDTAATSGGIKVGLTKDQVVDLLGKANLELTTRWSYKLGDYLKFHLYFENDRVTFLSLTMPA